MLCTIGCSLNSESVFLLKWLCSQSFACSSWLLTVVHECRVICSCNGEAPETTSVIQYDTSALKHSIALTMDTMRILMAEEAACQYISVLGYRFRQQRVWLDAVWGLAGCACVSGGWWRVRLCEWTVLEDWGSVLVKGSCCVAHLGAGCWRFLKGCGARKGRSRCFGAYFRSRVVVKLGHV